MIDESVKDIVYKMDKSNNLDAHKLERAYEIYEMKLGQYDDQYQSYTGILKEYIKDTNKKSLKELVNELNSKISNSENWSSDMKYKLIPEIVAYFVAMIVLLKNE